MSYNNSNTQNARRNINRKVVWFNPPYSQNVKTTIGNNVGNMIKQHNSKVLSKTNDNNNQKCNCRSKPNCTLNGECPTQCLVYRVTSTTSSNSFVYYGTSEGEFKTWYSNHTKSFRHRECISETELSKHVWNVKYYGLDNSLIMYQCGSKRCDIIICADPDTLLNRRTELISKCHYRNKFL